MSFTDNKMTVSLPVGSDQSASIYKFAKGSATGIIACSVAGEAAIGIIQTNDGSAVGRPVETAIGGGCKVVAGAIVPAWSEIATDATGQAVVAVAGDVVLGINPEAAAAAGDVMNIIFNPSYIKPA